MNDMCNSTVRFSLILGTVNRVQPLDRMLESLAAQSYVNFELILVDQNADDRLGSLVSRWEKQISIVHVRSGTGLSRARNVGAAYARGDLIGFPDDDCWYPSDLLSDVSKWFYLNKRFTLLSTGARDESGSEVASRWPEHSCAITRKNVFRACVSFGIFLRKEALIAAGGFDENLGLGSNTRFQSGEESDLALRVIEQAGEGWFEKSMWTYHPKKDAATASSHRALTYGAGFGYLLRKHRYPLHSWFYHVLRALAGAIKAMCGLNSTEALFYWNSARGRVAGYLSSHPVSDKSQLVKPAAR